MKKIECDLCKELIKKDEVVKGRDIVGYIDGERFFIEIRFDDDENDVDLCDSCFWKIVRGEINLGEKPPTNEKEFNPQYKIPTREESINSIVRKLDENKGIEIKLRNELDMISK